MHRSAILPLLLAGGVLAAQGPGFPPPDPQGASAGPLAAQVPPRPCRPAAGAMRPAGPLAPFQALDLSPDQNQAVQGVLERRRAAGKGLRQSVEGKEDALRAALEDPATPEARLRALHAEASAARLQDLLEQRALVLELDAVLTPDQRAKAARIRAFRQKEREAHRALLEEMGETPGPRPPLL